MTDAQRRMIYKCKNELGWDDEFLHNVVKGVTGKEHISELSKYEAIDVIDHMEGKSNKNSWNHIPNRISKEQIWKINDLAKKLGWSNNPKRLLGFIRTFYNVEALQWLTKAQAWKVIEGLKAQLERQEKTHPGSTISHDSCQK